jgi:hypothetical protein
MLSDTFFELLHIIARDILLFGGALLVIFFLVLLIFAILTLIKVNKLISSFNETFLQFREGMQKLLDPLLMFVNMLRISVDKHGKQKTTTKKVNKKKTKI